MEGFPNVELLLITVMPCTPRRSSKPERKRACVSPHGRGWSQLELADLIAAASVAVLRPHNAVEPEWVGEVL